MGRAIAVRTDYTAGEVRRLAKRAKDAAQARRLLGSSVRAVCTENPIRIDGNRESPKLNR